MAARGAHECSAFVECVFDCAGGYSGESAAGHEGVAGEVKGFEVVDVGIRQRLVTAGDAFSGEQVQDGGFGDVVSAGEFDGGGAVSVGLDELVDGVAGESALDVPGRLGKCRAG